MLKGLEAINWSEVNSCYIPGEQIPILILALTSDDEQTQTEAIEELDANLYHQGDVYDAAKYAAPFLLELLEIDSVKKKKEILSLLNICAAYSPRGLHTWTPEVAAAIGDGLPVYRKLLDNGDPDVRSYALELFYHFSETSSPQFASELYRRLDKEDDFQIKIDLALYLGSAIASDQLPESDVVQYRKGLHSQVASEQDIYTSAGMKIGLMSLPKGQIDETIFGDLLNQIRQLQDAEHPRIERLVHSISHLLRYLDNSGDAEYLARLVEVVRLDGCMSFAVENLLERVFERDKQVNIKNLTPDQKRALVAILSNDDIWANDYVVGKLPLFGLPLDRSFLRQILGND